MNTNKKNLWKGQLTTDASFCSLHCYSSLPPLCMYVHTSFWVSVETLFICLWAYCVPSSWLLILPKYRDSLPFFSLFFSLLKNSSINSCCFSHHLCEDASQISTHSISSCLLGISIWKSFLHSNVACPKLNSLIPHYLSFFPILCLC